MLLRIIQLQHYGVRASDGDIGRVHDLYFDDEEWTVRHVVVTTGHWLSRHRVLLPLASLRKVDTGCRELQLSLTKAQVSKSPDVRTDQPVSRQHEASLLHYFGFPYYWHGPALAPEENWEGVGDPHLRSVHEVSGYFVRGRDAELGRVTDFLADDDGWVIRYLVVDMHVEQPGKKILLAPQWIRAIHWAAAEVEVEPPPEQIGDAPEYDPACSVDREYEQRLHDYFRRPPYWRDDGRS